MSALMAHVRVGQWASIVPNSALESVELTDTLRAIPIVEPEVFHTVGLVVSDRYPVQPAVTSLIEEARARAAGTASRRLGGCPPSPAFDCNLQ
jgi:DNA-binding transcriptional LysR family regulator